MTSWTNTTPPRHLWRAVVRAERLEADVVRGALPGDGVLAGWIEQVWSVAWAAPVPASTSAVIAHPTIHFTVEAGAAGEVRHGHPMPAALAHGVVLERFALALPAHGWVVGLHLTPGTVYDLTRLPAHTLTGRVVTWDQAWPGWNLDSVWAADGPDARMQALRDLAATHLADRARSQNGLRASATERLVRTERDIRTVEELADRADTSVRGLQRLCRDHLGVSPRWLLRRARVLDAHELLAETQADLADIAHQLGWYDQAHFTRDYTAVTGVPPARLRRELEQDRHA